ncbi:MAG: transposase, partial [Salinibacter sp.]
ARRKSPKRSRRKSSVFWNGTLDLTSGRAFTQAFEKGRSDYTIEYLESLLEETAGKVLLIWDQATWHTSGQVTEWLKNTGRIETYLLPVRSPEANPMEDLWRELKEQVAACLERSLDTLLESRQEYFEALSGAVHLNSWALSELTYFFCST